MTNNSMAAAKHNLDYAISLKWLSFNGFFIFLLFASLPQQNAPIFILLISRICLILANLCAALICFWVFRNKGTAMFIIFSMLLLKFSREIYDQLLVPYVFFMGFLFCSIGAVMMLKKNRLIYQQVLFFCLISIPMMLLQISGAGDWTQFMSSQVEEVGGLRIRPTLFVPANILSVTHLQNRPGGFAHSNNLLAIIVVFLMALHFGRMRNSKLTWGDLIVCAMVVLTGAKLPVFVFIFLLFLRLLLGKKTEKIKMVKIVLLFAAVVGIFTFFFPGIIASNCHWEFWVSHTIFRYLDFVAAITNNYEAYKSTTVIVGNHVMTLTLAGRESAYALLASVLPFVVVISFLMLPFYIKGFKQIKNIPGLGQTTIALFLLSFFILIYPALLEGQIFWFIIGFGLLPLYVVFFFKKSFLLSMQAPVPKLREESKG